MLRDLIRIARPYQWIKNLFIFVPLFFAFNIYGMWEIDYRVAISVFLGFSLVCSSVYCLNDIVDRHYDRAHPTKQHRPIASGRVSVGAGVVLMLILALGGGGHYLPVFLLARFSFLLVFM